MDTTTLPLPVAEATPALRCSCVNVPLGEPLAHWCGWPGPCCTARQGKPWRRAKNLNHLPICHEQCWRKDAEEVAKRVQLMDIDLQSVLALSRALAAPGRPR